MDELGPSHDSIYARQMPKVQQTFRNDRKEPIYIYVEPWPECFELETGDKLTLIWEATEVGDVANVDVFSECEFAIWPNGATDDMQFLFNGEPGYDRTWVFKHR